MFYDIFLDELFYLREEEDNLNSKIDLFAGLNNYSKDEINSFKNGKVTVIKREKDINNFIRTSRNVFSNNGKLYYGKLNEEVSNKIKKVLHYDLKGFNLSIQTHNLKHIQKAHGNPIKEIVRGQINVTDHDYYLIPTIIKDFDYLKKTHPNEYNNKSLKFKKRIGNITYNIIAYISFRSHNLEIKTFYKQKKNSTKVL